MVRYSREFVITVIVMTEFDCNSFQKRETSWGLVELLPDLHMERAYEDHEFLVENLLMWKADSKNTLWFIKRPEVFDLFNR